MGAFSTSGGPTTGTSASPRGSVFTRFALRSLSANRSRTIVSVVGIALSCALITAIFTSVTTLFSGMLTAEVARNGAWQVKFENLSADALGKLCDDSRVQDLYERPTYGSALMPAAFQGFWGRYLTLQQWPSEQDLHGLVIDPDIVEGRAPSQPGEIVLDANMKGLTTEQGRELFDMLPTTGKDEVAPASWEDGIDIGSAITLQLGQRTFHDAERNRDRACLASEGTYTTETKQGTALSEWLASPGPVQTYTVVGFYDQETAYSTSWMLGSGYLGFVSGEDLTARSTDAFVGTDLATYPELLDLIKDYTGMDMPVFMSGGTVLEYWDNSTFAEIHDSLLRYQGIDQERAIYSTLYLMAAILSLVVVVASISLIYNSFAIAVSERTRQYGLLASLGASRRQIRRTVYTEALLLAAIGIPAGILLGLAGTWVVFQLSSEGIGALIDADLFYESGFSSLHVSPTVIGICVVLSLITVLVSAAIPAIRASRVSAVDAIRQSRDVKLTRRERRVATNGRAGLFDRFYLRLGGVSGWIAHRNLTRSSSKGRVAVASLAVSVALLITSCAIGRSLGDIAQITGNGSTADIQVMVDRVLMGDETAADGTAAVDELYRKLGDVEGATPLGYAMYATMYAHADAGVLDTDELATSAYNAGNDEPLIDDDGGVHALIQLAFVDDGTWRAAVQQAHLDERRFCDPEQPVGIALNKARMNNGMQYATFDYFAGTGDVSLYTLIADPDANDGNSRYLTQLDMRDGEIQALFDVYNDAGIAEEGRAVPLGQALVTSVELPVGAVSDTWPEMLQADSTYPIVMLPISALPTLAAPTADVDASALGSTMSALLVMNGTTGAASLYTYLNFDTERPREAGAAMQEILDGTHGGGWQNSYLNNNAEHARQAALMYGTIQLFISCFALITGAIAVANVFNTLSSSIILRRREFAMLKSCGMGPSTFRRMIVLECASYAWRGLAIGILLGGVVAFALHQAVSISFYGSEFYLPPWWIALAAAIVIGVLALSAIYALRKAGANSIVQTLREDAI